MRISDWSSDVCSSDLLYQVLGSAALESGLIEFSLFEGYGPVAGDFFGFFTAAGGLTVGDDLSYAFLGVADGFDFEVSFSDEGAGLTILNDAGAGNAMILDRKSTRLNSSH